MDWMLAAQSAMRPDARAIFERMTGAGRSFLDQVAQLSEVISKAAAANQDKVNEVLTQAMDTLKRQWTGNATQDFSATNFWRQGLDAWNQFALAASGISTQTMPHWGGALAPPVGYLREHQEKWQTWLRCAGDYAAAQQAHMSLLNEAMQKGLEHMASQAADLVREGKAPDTPRKVYDLWVDCTEEAYADLAVDPRYAKSQGQMMKALLELKAAAEALARPALTAMGAADNATLDTVTRRLHELQHEVRELKEQIASRNAGAKSPRPRKSARASKN
jgi:class III poly(R)-hydroxyalkanoic acid synthase PhaE subunit